jgi:hypothetical protein
MIWLLWFCLALQVSAIVFTIISKKWDLAFAHFGSTLWISMLLNWIYNELKRGRRDYEGWAHDQRLIDKLFRTLEEGTTTLQKIATMAGVKKTKKEDMN